MESDHGWLLEIAGERLAQSGQAERAGRAWTLALEVWRALDAEQDVTRVSERLDALGA